MAMIGGNWTNHPDRPSVEKSIRTRAKLLSIEGQLPDLSVLNWNDLRKLDTYLWGKLQGQEVGSIL